jgi:phosphoribosylanthranilate isomerase
MPLKIHIKAGNITSLTDARYFAAREVSWLGFCFDPKNTAYIQPSVVKAMKEWVEGPQLIGEFGAQDADEIIAIAAAIGLDALQIPYSFPADEWLKFNSHLVIVHLLMAKITTTAALRAIIDATSAIASGYLLDFEEQTWEEITHSSIPFVDLEGIFNEHKCFLHGNLTTATLPDVLQYLRPYSLELRGSAEEKVGIKSFDEMDELLDVLEVEL